MLSFFVVIILIMTLHRRNLEAKSRFGRLPATLLVIAERLSNSELAQILMRTWHNSDY